MARRTRSRVQAVLAGGLLLALVGCSGPAAKPCEGLAYTDAGVSREQFASCARAMVAELDEVWADVQTFYNHNLPESERKRARQSCLSNSSDLAHLIDQAGGTDKLTRIEWADEDLSEFNRDIEHARMVYFLYCFQPGVARSPTGMIQQHAEARRFVASLP